MNKAYDRLILEALLDKYERTNAFRTGISSSKRVLLKLYDSGKTDFSLYDIEESVCRVEINQAVLNLASKDLLCFEWMKGEKNHILAKVWLNLELLSNAYAYVGKTPKNDEIDVICLHILDSLDDAQTNWAQRFLQDTYDAISTKRSIGKRLPEDKQERDDLLDAICFSSKMQEVQLLERVFSMQCFGDSKRFEHTVRKRLLSILRKYLDLEVDATDEDLLRQVGIVKYPEQFEFCGNILLRTTQADISFSNLNYGVSLFRDELTQRDFVIDHTVERIISIENRANFIDYIYRQRAENELVIYHGGQYSPAKKKFLQKIASAMSDGCTWLHWGDIDYGGFSMLARLRREINKNVKPYLMGMNELTQYEKLCCTISPEYTKKLKQLLAHEELSDCFPTLQYMISTKIKLEQEAFLTE